MFSSIIEWLDRHFEGGNLYYKGYEREKSEFSCSGCYLSITCGKNRTGCVASSSDKVFDSCKHDHVIFVRV